MPFPLAIQESRPFFLKSQNNTVEAEIKSEQRIKQNDVRSLDMVLLPFRLVTGSHRLSGLRSVCGSCTIASTASPTAVNLTALA
jgi:hypothetical protein